MKVLIIGASGPTGLELVKQGVALGHDVWAGVRDLETSAIPDSANKIHADVRDLQVLRMAVSGRDAVICSLGSKLSRQATTLLSEGTRNLVEVMESAQVRRLLCITGIGAGDSKGHGGFVYDHLIEPLLLHEIYLDKTRQEKVVQASRLDWTLVRPAQLTNGELTGKVRSFTNLEGITVSKISRADVAAFLLERLADVSSYGKTYTISY